MLENDTEITIREEEPPTIAHTARLCLRWVWPAMRIERLQGARLGIGRDLAAAIRLDGTCVSRQHAELYRQGPLYVVRDLASTNGTWLNGRRVEHAPVSPGSVLRIGQWVGVFAMQSDGCCEFGEHAPGVFGGPEIADLSAMLARAAKSTLPVILVGSTGSGKERFARATHLLSGRSGQFCAVNCAALPESLAEAELFGYRRGAFTGAEKASVGFFRASHGGTLFLDEMPDLSPGLQAKLLRVVEDGEVQGLGECVPTPVDVRIVCASQERLSELVARKRFRKDLAARLSGLELCIPPLAARRADVAGLFAQFVRRQCGGRVPQIESNLVEALCLHTWPQNVRELELLTRRLLIVHGHESRLQRGHLPPELAELVQDENAAKAQPSAPKARRDHDLARLKEEIKNTGGNVKAAAEALGISRQRIYRLLGASAVDAGADRVDGACS